MVRMEFQMPTFATTRFPEVDPRVEFWSDQNRWPRNTVQHAFLANIVHDLGRCLFGAAWSGDEPATVLHYPIRHVHDTATTGSDIAIAVAILYRHHTGFRSRTDAASAQGQPAPLPSSDEWAIAHALSRQIADARWGAIKRYNDVMGTLVTLFEMGILVAARRHHVVGRPTPIASWEWINEIFPAWFATCQIDPDDAFSGIAVRDGGEWIYIETDGYLAWRDASFGVIISTGQSPGAPAGPAQEGEQSVDADQAGDHEAPARHRGKPGNKPAYDWPTFNAEALRRAASPERPRSARALAKEMLEWCSEAWGREPGESVVRKRLRTLLAENGLQYK